MQSILLSDEAWRWIAQGGSANDAKTISRIDGSQRRGWEGYRPTFPRWPGIGVNGSILLGYPDAETHAW